jgi:hypothetical protein
MDVGSAEHGLGLLGPIAWAKTALDATLAVAETTTYPGVHLKYLAEQGEEEWVILFQTPEKPGYFKFSSSSASRKSKTSRFFRD